MCIRDRSRTVRGIHGHRVGQCQQFVMQTVIKHSRKLPRRVRAGKIGASNIANKQRVAGQNRRRLCRLGCICGAFISKYEANALWRVSRRLQRANQHRSHFHFETVGQRHMRKSRVGLRSNVDLCAGTRREFLVSGNKVSVQVSFENVPDLSLIHI